MNESVASLLVIQDRDSKIEGLLQELKRLPAEKQRIAHYRDQRQETLKKAKKDVLDTEMAIKNMEAEIGAKKTGLQRLKTQQMETRKNEEYQAMGREITRTEEDIDEMETQELGLMDQLDANKEAYAKAEEKFKAVEKTIDQELADLEGKTSRLEAELSALENERNKLASDLDPLLMERYDRMKKSKGLPVVVLLDESGQCAGCHTKVIRSTESQVRSQQGVVECENCGRILH